MEEVSMITTAYFFVIAAWLVGIPLCFGILDEMEGWDSGDDIVWVSIIWPIAVVVIVVFYVLRLFVPIGRWIGRIIIKRRKQ